MKKSMILSLFIATGLALAPLAPAAYAADDMKKDSAMSKDTSKDKKMKKGSKDSKKESTSKDNTSKEK